MATIKEIEEMLDATDVGIKDAAEGLEKILAFKQQCEQSFALKVGEGVDPKIMMLIISSLLDTHAQMKNDFPEWEFPNPESVIQGLGNIVRNMHQPKGDVKTGSFEYWSGIFQSLAVVMVQGLYQLRIEINKQIAIAREKDNNDAKDDINDRTE